ncbi:hypothetical protein [Paracoccus sp. T5]|uniref:hypothetical protein n=1 Tax=Paracoccus sp. T5 TaxID=3402161 RepID=UPI003ADD47B1
MHHDAQTVDDPAQTSAVASASLTRPRLHLWIVMQDTKEGISFERFFSRVARDAWLQKWCADRWTADKGKMPADWQDAYQVLSESGEDFLHLSEPFDLSGHPDLAMLAFDARTRAIMLAALRLWQRMSPAGYLQETIIATDAGAFDPLSQSEINRLCRIVGAFQ